MNLRLRLIVAFFLLSVVPLGAVTYYTYVSNAQAIRDAAGYEAEALATELSQRMQVVTTQISQRVEQLMNLPAEPVAATNTAPASFPTATAAAASAAAAAQAAAAENERITATLGNFAAVLNNIEVRGLRGFRGRGGRGGRGGPPPDGAARGNGPFIGPAPDGRGTPAAAPGSTAAGPSIPSQASNVPSADTNGRRDGGPPNDGTPGGPGGRGGFNSGEGPGQGRSGGRGGPPDTPDDGRIRIDLNQVRRDMFDELAPDREAFGKLPPEEQRAVFAQIDQRMLGVAQGIKVLQSELSTLTADARMKELVAGAAIVGGAAQVQLQTPGPAPPAVPAAPVALAAPAAPAAVAASSGTQRSTELSGSRLAVRLERDGEVVGQVDADVDFPELLKSVFTATSRDRGEVPFAVGQDGRVYAPTDADRQQIAALNTVAVVPATAAGTTVLEDWIVATTQDPGGSGLKFGIARPVGEALRDLERSSTRNAGFGLAFITLALIGIVPLASGLTRNLSSLSEGVHRIAQGDYSARVTVRSRDEVGRLATAFNLMAADVEIHHRSAVEQERIRRELELGRQIQHDMLPQSPLRLGLTEVKGVSVPAREVGGDFFNYFQLKDGTLALLVGDVSGKGVGAALLMANIQAALRTRLSLGQDLASLAQELDLDIERSTPGPVYATLFVGIFDPVTRQLRCVNAGHNPQYVLRSNGGLERMESTGRPIGLFAGGGYTEQHISLTAGDVLFFYTDGCVEAENAAGDMFGSERLEQALFQAVGRDPDEVLVAVEADVSRFRAGIELQDDATMMVVKVG